ncbi:ATP-binding protein [Candidatus Rariloculus sp.]|uniref:ATP-binding protein n=1 Tax=Candidatus Rariloculus sp. TaxID=3101265 RepID=UPI003D152EA9
MGKTSLVRELVRRLKEDGSFETIFVDLEAADTPADVIAEIGIKSRSVQGVWRRLNSWLANIMPAEFSIGGRVDALGSADLRVKLRAGIDPGNWRQKGDELFAALAGNSRPVVLAIDELPILVNRLLKGHDYRITPERRQAVDQFLSWLRKNGQTHRGRISMILSGSVSLEPILEQAELSAHANIFRPFELKPWDGDTAADCLAALAESYGIELPEPVRQDICHRLRCQIPHHVQAFFDSVHEYLRRARRSKASLEDIERVYDGDMLGVRGQMDLEHYQSRLRMVLGSAGYRIALELLTEAAVSGGVLHDDFIDRYCTHIGARTENPEAEPVAIENILHVLEHDGYLAKESDGYRFVSGLLEDWWRARYGQRFVPIEQRKF